MKEETKKELIEVYKRIEKNVERVGTFDSVFFIFCLFVFTTFFVRLYEYDNGFIFNNIFLIEPITGLTVFMGICLSTIILLKFLKGILLFISGVFIWIYGFLYISGNEPNMIFLRLGLFFSFIFYAIKLKIILYEFKSKNAVKK